MKHLLRFQLKRMSKDKIPYKSMEIKKDCVQSKVR